MLPHQLRFWNDMVDQILLVFDLHGYNTENDQADIARVRSLIKDLRKSYPKLEMIDVDYSPAAKKIISNAFFNGKSVPAKTHRYGPYYSYFFGLYHTKHDYILSIDCDIFFGGRSHSWVKEAIKLLNSDETIITCSPLPGAPRADGKLTRQTGTVDNSKLKMIKFDSISSRIFFIHKPSFIEKICPIPIKVASLPLAIRALLRKRPVFELPEDTITWIMRQKNLIRVDFLGTNQGVWSIHPPYRNEAFYLSLTSLIKRIETDEIPPEQRGDYDLNSSMIDWDDAKEAIRAASMKNKIFKAIGLK